MVQEQAAIINKTVLARRLEETLLEQTVQLVSTQWPIIKPIERLEDYEK